MPDRQELFLFRGGPFYVLQRAAGLPVGPASEPGRFLGSAARWSPSVRRPGACRPPPRGREAGGHSSSQAAGTAREGAALNATARLNLHSHCNNTRGRWRSRPSPWWPPTSGRADRTRPARPDRDRRRPARADRGRRAAAQRGPASRARGASRRAAPPVPSRDRRRRSGAPMSRLSLHWDCNKFTARIDGSPSLRPGARRRVDGRIARGERARGRDRGRAARR